MDPVPLFSPPLHCLFPLLSGDLLDTLVYFQVYRSCRGRDVAVAGVVDIADVWELSFKDCNHPSTPWTPRIFLAHSHLPFIALDTIGKELEVRSEPKEHQDQDQGHITKPDYNEEMYDEEEYADDYTN